MALAKRIIPCLDVKDGRCVKGVNFQNLVDAGDIVELATRYSEQGADELVFLDITASYDKRETEQSWVRSVAEVLNIPFTVGGGISSEKQVELLLKQGADKVSVNSAAIRNPELITRIAKEFGSQCVVVAIDAKREDKPFGTYRAGDWQLYVQGGRKPVGMELMSWAKQAEELGAGEILFTSMDHDGTNNGFAIEQYDRLSNSLSIPIIASGGAGSAQHIVELFQNSGADAALAAGIFHRGEVTIAQVKQLMINAGIYARF
ncbi:MAG: imidazole glycerol phosphate synthase subunit HisF [Marinifilaceae bacterium]|nr:imidazole glycerol phosphate synthase subunit HisF [Marinifilaceae bacterium]